MLAKGWKNGNHHALLVRRMYNSIITLKTSVAAYYSRNESKYLHKTYTNVHSHFIQNNQNRAATKIHMNSSMKKRMLVIHTLE